MKLRTKPDPVIMIDLNRHLSSLHDSLTPPQPQPSALADALSALILAAMLILGLFLAFGLQLP